MEQSLGKKETTQLNLRKRIYRAVQLIEQHYDSPLTARELATAVGISLSHFHLAFQTIIGEPVAKHILRLRLERAASMLKYSSWQSGDIGLECGFQTQASFTRGFKRLYGLSPHVYRKQHCETPFLQGAMRTRPEITSSTSSPLPPPLVTLENWKTLEVICLRFYGSIGDLHKPWSELLKWAKHHITDLDNARFFGLWFDDWSGLNDSQYRYECAILPANALTQTLPEPFFMRTIPTGQMALASAQGNINHLNQAWMTFANGWLPQSTLQPREDYAFDEYPQKLMLSSPLHQLIKVIAGSISLTMCLPVQKHKTHY